MKKRKGNRNTNKQQQVVLQSNIDTITEGMLVRAIVKAYETIDSNKKIEGQHEQGKIEWYIKVFALLNVTFFPWKLSKKFVLNSQIYNGLLTVIVSWMLEVIGFVLWIMGIFAILYGIIMVTTGVVFVVIVIGIALMVMGSMFMLSGKEFHKVSDSNRIYAYSASILALISCVVSVISLVKQLM